jgi:hypothetical protein
VPPYRHRQQRALHVVRYGPRHFWRHYISRQGHLHHARSKREASGKIRSVSHPKLRKRRNRRVRITVGIVFAVIVLALLALGFSAYRSLESAKRSINAARFIIDQDLANQQEFISTTGRATLATDLVTIQAEVASASSSLHGSLGIKVLGSLPYLSDQRRGVESLVSDAGTTAGTVSDLLGHVDTLVDQSSGTTVSLSALTSLQQAVVQAHATMEGLPRPAGNLFGSLGNASRDFNRQLAKITTLLQRGNRAISFALPFLGSEGPRTYLIAGENNAEMRDQGAVLSLAEMHTDDGTYSVTTVGSVDSLQPSQAVSVPESAATNLVFGGYEPTQLWQSVNATADYPFSARVMQAMFAQVQGVHVDGVIALDVPALASLLDLSGPVPVPGIPGLISGEDVATVLLHDQYAQYPAGAAQQERHDNIAATATAVVDQMKVEHVDLATLAHEVANDIAGRHVLVWDDNPQFESTLAQLGASGSIDGTDADRTIHIAVENSTATKLDYYVGDSIDDHVQILPNGDAVVNTTVTVHNDAPAGAGPSFQTGPDGINSFVPGQYVTRVLAWLPRGSDAPKTISESGLELTQSQLSVLPQQSGSVSFGTLIHHAVTNGHFNLRFVPQPRLVPSELTVEISAEGWHLGGPSRVSEPLAVTTELQWSLSK